MLSVSQIIINPIVGGHGREALERQRNWGGRVGGAPSNRLDTQIDRRKNTEIKIHVGLRLDGRRSIILHSTTNQEHADVAKNGTEGGGTGGGVPGQHNTIYLGAIVIRMNRNN